MRSLKTVLLVVVLLAFAFLLTPVKAAAEEISGTCDFYITWTLDDSGTLTISGTGHNGYGYLKDWSWSDSPFYSNEDIKTVVIQEGVVKIGSSAFNGCSNLTSVTIPDTVTSIGSCAFYECTSLTSVTIPDSVTFIGDMAFDDCRSLASISLPDSVIDSGDFVFDNTAFQSNKSNWEDGYLYIGKHLIDAKNDNGTYSIREGTITIFGSAFLYISNMTEITIPDSVKAIGKGAFEGCTGLTSITIPDTVTHIGDQMLNGCKNLTSVTIPDSVTYIGPYTFGTCSSLTSIMIPENVTIIESKAFSGCTSLTSITIPEKVTLIGSWAFEGCTGLKNVTIPDSVTFLSSRVFEQCTGLTSVSIGNGVTSISGSMFSGCSALESVTIPGGVTSIGENAFADCSALTDVFFAGSEQQWNQIEISDGNVSLTEAAIHFNSTGSSVAMDKPETVSVDGKKAASVTVSCPANRQAVAVGARYAADGRFLGLGQFKLFPGEDNKLILTFEDGSIVRFMAISDSTFEPLCESASVEAQ